MKISIDINHPAHVHYFRGFIIEMKELGHEFIITNRDDKLINYLLDFFQIDHHIRNKRPGRSGSLKSLIYLLKAVLLVNRQLRNKKIDVFMGFGSSIAAINAAILRKPCILLDDTEHNKFNHAIYRPFVSALLTPFYFQKKIVEGQIYFKAYIENFYLEILEKSFSKEHEPYILCRFTSFDASHDRNVDVESLEAHRKNIVELLSQQYKVIVCPEDEGLNEKYKDYLIVYKPEEIHTLISGASLFISDGATMACEAGILGVPYVYTNPLKVGYIDQQCQTMGHAFQMNYQTLCGQLEYDLDCFFKENDNTLRRIPDFIDPTGFLVWFVTNYPKSYDLCQSQMIDQDKFDFVQREI